jgi:predicted nucleic acid-binding Zn ribbon protein
VGGRWPARAGRTALTAGERPGRSGRNWERTERPVRRLGEALSEVAADLNLDNPDDVAAVMAAWPSAVGEAVAAHVRPRRLHDGELLVEVDAPVWATQLRYLEDDVLRQLGRKVRPGVVRSIRPVVRRA